MRLVTRSALATIIGVALGLSVPRFTEEGATTVEARTVPCGTFSMSVQVPFLWWTQFGHGQSCSGAVARSWLDDGWGNPATAEALEVATRWLGTDLCNVVEPTNNAALYRVKDEAEATCQNCTSILEVANIIDSCDCACETGDPFVFCSPMNFHVARHRWDPIEDGRKTRFTSRGLHLAGCHSHPDLNTNCWWTNVDTDGGHGLCPVFCTRCNSGSGWGQCPWGPC
jgi:hypothetical protein